MSKFALPLLILCLLFVRADAQDAIPIAPRDWTIQRETVEAVFISLDGDKVALHRMSDNEKITVPLADFADDDKQYLVRLGGTPEIKERAREPIATIEGPIVKIVDGDTFEIRTGAGRVRLRLDGVDAPEIRQPFGAEARATLSRACQREHVEARIFAYDDFGRAIAQVTLTQVKDAEPQDVALEMLRLGCVWLQGTPENQAYAEAAEEAKAARRGLWAADKPIAPWLWRKQRGGAR